MRTSQQSKLVDPAISQAVTTTATSVLNKQLTSTYIENVYVGFNTLGEQLGEGGHRRRWALGRADPARERDPPARRRSGAASDRRVVAGGTGSRQLSDGASGLANGLHPRLERDGVQGGARQLAGTGGDDVRHPTAATNGINAAVSKDCAPRRDPAWTALCADRSRRQPDLEHGPDVRRGPHLGQPGSRPSSGSTPAASSQSASGAAQLASGAIAVRGRRTAAGDRCSAAERRDPGTRVRRRSVGVGHAPLASGLHTAVAQLPSYDSGDRTSLAKVAAEPVTQKASGTTAFGTSSIPLFASVALWLGALATFLVLQALSRRALLTSRAAGRIALDGFASNTLSRVHAARNHHRLQLRVRVLRRHLGRFDRAPPTWPAAEPRRPEAMQLRRRRR